METPRLRLLLLAHTRGLLAPDYKFGVRSKIREELVLQALAKEVDGRLTETRSILETSLMPFVEPNMRTEVFEHALTLLSKARHLQALGTYNEVTEGNVPGQAGDVKDMVSLLNVLKATDFYDKMEALLRAS